VNREAIYQALFDRVKNLSGLVTASRTLRHWDDVPLVEQPALFQEQVPEARKRQRGLPPVLTLAADLALYVKPGEGFNAAPSQQLNPLLDALDAALAPEPAKETQTLGGLVEDCWIASIDIYEGVAVGQTVAIVRVQILVA
jgi:hypothetical protein